jgi:phosphoribosyl-ATP pyrophosphohydrolase
MDKQVLEDDVPGLDPAPAQRAQRAAGEQDGPATDDALTLPGAAVLDDLFRVILDRRAHGDPELSHTARLFARGRAKIAQKVGEEAVETVIEAMRGDQDKLAQESADLLYHLLALWADMDLNPGRVYAILDARQGVSGLEEKKNRKLQSKAS